MEARGRPQRAQRWCCWTGKLAVGAALTTKDFLATGLLPAERHAKPGQQAACLVVGFGGGHDGDLHAAGLVDLVVVDLGEDELLPKSQGVVAVAVEGGFGHAPEVTDPGKRYADQLVEEVPHAGSAQSHLESDRHPLPKAERRHRLLGLEHDRLLAGDQAQVVAGVVDRLAVLDRLADADVDDDLLDPRDLHDIAVVKLLQHFGRDLLLVLGAQARQFRRRGRAHAEVTCSVISPQWLQARPWLPSRSSVWRIRVGRSHDGQTSITLGWLSGASKSTM